MFIEHSAVLHKDFFFFTNIYYIVDINSLSCPVNPLDRFPSTFMSSIHTGFYVGTETAGSTNDQLSFSLLK